MRHDVRRHQIWWNCRKVITDHLCRFLQSVFERMYATTQTRNPEVIWEELHRHSSRQRMRIRHKVPIAQTASRFNKPFFHNTLDRLMNRRTDGRIDRWDRRQPVLIIYPLNALLIAATGLKMYVQFQDHLITPVFINTQLPKVSTGRLSHEHQTSCSECRRCVHKKLRVIGLQGGPKNRTLYSCPYLC